MREVDPIMPHGKLFGRLLNPSTRSSQQKLSKTSVNMEAGTLIGYFAERDEARRSLRELQRRGFRRAAWVHKTADGEVYIGDPFLWRRALWATLTAILFGSLAGVASLVFHGSVSILSGSLSTLVSIFA